MLDASSITLQRIFQTLLIQLSPKAFENIMNIFTTKYVQDFRNSQNQKAQNR